MLASYLSCVVYHTDSNLPTQGGIVSFLSRVPCPPSQDCMGKVTHPQMCPHPWAPSPRPTRGTRLPCPFEHLAEMRQMLVFPAPRCVAVYAVTASQSQFFRNIFGKECAIFKCPMSIFQPTHVGSCIFTCAKAWKWAKTQSG